jgi:hypothetical protein
MTSKFLHWHTTVMARMWIVGVRRPLLFTLNSFVPEVLAHQTVSALRVALKEVQRQVCTLCT